MKKEFKPLSWKVKYFDFNTQVIKDYDILKNQESWIKQLKKECATKESFSKELRSEYMYRFWSKSEWELLIGIDPDNRVLLTPWCGCRDLEKARIDVTKDRSFDWLSFAKKHIQQQIFENAAKIDVFDQLEWRWDEFVDYCWNTRLKYERKRVEVNKYARDN